MPKAELAESFRPRLQHRLFHLDDEAVSHPGKGSATSVVTVLGMAILLSAVAWSPMIGNGVPEVVLPAIVVSGPPVLDPLFDRDAIRATPVSSDLFSGGLWSDAESLLYEYSPMSERSRRQGDGNQRALRRTGLD
jgi:hypothetical protein